MRRAFSLAVVVFALAVQPGCGPGKAEISGVVTYQKKPVYGCSITFFDQYNGVESCPLKEDGSYVVPNVNTGTAKIVIAMPLDMSIPGMPVAKFTPVPDKYGTADTTPLTYHVKRGPQKHDIELD